MKTYENVYQKDSLEVMLKRKKSEDDTNNEDTRYTHDESDVKEENTVKKPMKIMKSELDTVKQVYFQNLVFTDAYQRNLEYHLERVFSYFFSSGLNKGIVDVLQNEYKAGIVKAHALVTYTINMNTVVMGSEAKLIEDDRPAEMKRLLENTICWCQKHQLTVPETTLHVYIADRFPFCEESLDRFPIFVFAKPRNYNFPIVPDYSFVKFNCYEKYNGKALDWDEVKEKFETFTPAEQKNVIYFKGTDTTNRNNNIRKTFKMFASLKMPIKMEILLDAWQSYEPVWYLKQYKYLLNLPGRYPWSVRMRYLALTGRIVINVDVITKSLSPVYFDDYYECFSDLVLRRNEHYVNLQYMYYRCNSAKSPLSIQNKVKRMQIEENKKLEVSVEKVCKDILQNPKVYEDKAIKAKEAMNELSLARVYQYMYKAICYNAHLLKTCLD